ncbi:hypothetical protein [Polaromonas aquatica]|uniref:hypothetical protein n=1 Tax=Polaromonas aquatica TaxID=332657 RepID=UPI003D65949A
MDAMFHDRELTPRSFLDRRDEINAKLRSKRQIELRVALYAFGEEALIACATSGFSEAGTPVRLPFSVSNDDLGQAVRELLLQTYLHPVPSHTDAKLSDWPAFVVSGAKSGRAFEENCTYLSVETVNTALRIHASRRKPPSAVYIGQDHSLAVDSEELGASIRNLVSIVRRLDSQDAL